MRIKLQRLLKRVTSLEDVLLITTNLIAEIKNADGNVKIGYVSGKVTTDGSEKIITNLLRLHSYTRKLENIHGKYIFSAADIFNTEIYWKINLPRPIHEDDFYTFWRGVIRSGVTDIYMTPEWERSTGAKDEYEEAKKLNIRIHILK